MWQTYGDDVQFFVVYIREAHALDGVSPLGGGDLPLVEDPLDILERRGVAKQCMAALELEELPALVDEIDDGVANAYAAHPDRLYLVGKDERVAYQGGPGPFGFHPDELEEAIQRELALN